MPFMTVKSGASGRSNGQNYVMKLLFRVWFSVIGGISLVAILVACWLLSIHS